MFFCEDCRSKNNWPDSIRRSNGKCEVCDEPNSWCYDVPSKYLPIRREDKNENKIQSD